MSVMSLSELRELLSPRWLSCICLLVTIPVLAEELPDPSGGLARRIGMRVLREDRELRIFRCIFPPGVGHERHFHPRHFGYALSGGTMRVTSESGTREVTLKTGSYFFSEGIPWHEVVNVGDTTVSYLMIEPK